MAGGRGSFRGKKWPDHVSSDEFETITASAAGLFRRQRKAQPIYGSHPFVAEIRAEVQIRCQPKPPSGKSAGSGGLPAGGHYPAWLSLHPRSGSADALRPAIETERPNQLWRHKRARQRYSALRPARFRRYFDHRPIAGSAAPLPAPAAVPPHGVRIRGHSKLCDSLHVDGVCLRFRPKPRLVSRHSASLGQGPGGW